MAGENKGNTMSTHPQEVQHIMGATNQWNKILLCNIALLVVIVIGGICGSGKCSNAPSAGTLSGQSLDFAITNAPMPSAVQIRGNFPSSLPPQNGPPCGDGKVGNGICAESDLCCSKFGYCGSTDAYCADPKLPCGDGLIGNGTCINSTLCCSKYGLLNLRFDELQVCL